MNASSTTTRVGYITYRASQRTSHPRSRQRRDPAIANSYSTLCAMSATSKGSRGPSAICSNTSLKHRTDSRNAAQPDSSFSLHNRHNES